jgi:hypothetical protein
MNAFKQNGVILKVVAPFYIANRKLRSGNTKGGSITVPLNGLDYPVLQINTKIVSCHTADS